METESLISVYQAATNSKSGIFIEGPKGVGKSTSLFYVFHKLREEHPNALVILAFADTSTFNCNTSKIFTKNLLPAGR